MSAHASLDNGDVTTRTSHPLIVHVIPYDDIGGVETAADSVPPGPYPAFELRRIYVASVREPRPRPYVYESGVGSENSPRAFARTLRHLLDLRPKVVIVSLWRSCIVGLALKALRPRTRLVVFLHNVKHSNWVDSVLTRLAARASDAILADSTCTAEQRLGRDWAPHVRPVSFLTSRLSQVTPLGPSPRFITWGRLHPRKRIHLALDMFALVHAKRRDARFTIIGPDRGERAMLEAKAADLGVEEAVEFAGPKSIEEIALAAEQASFFVQTSSFEGMGMAAVEAMQLGLVPVVTPVGEIGSYVEDGRNGVWFETPHKAAERVEELLGAPDEFLAMRQAATRTWNDHPLHREDFLEACAMLASEDDQR
ncbi:glycosyltransferase family 4 protein [Novosphingobium aquimarinum]|uniref:glycosyltransferase family 4 protein n=1 Tax=Novosphingobium aquimarinum TaxID=2682494 RepID=UPI0018DCB080|nr:glycosyltransferase family 4 protein [Novosphingobium aquimarinum]